ncbi:MAG TPA: phosphoribosyl-AMP cyclohydrolase [Planctomycetota bacterium]|nr:phosphoribosyl-AMP cyclohydrolase [Planctomycetota bacterium]HRR79915.1 phosphoribosyl-AMP cyclohydrolase [Planctomycetota bacterium]HRT97871.1 phosphoribosyl-AMP cyclohydrolase [Planctomycetota bacterium]
MPLADQLRFDDKGLIPAIIFDAADHQPLTLCYMNRAALEETLATGLVHVFRRSKGRVMLKGETSGHTQRVVDVFADCEGNSLAIAVEQKVAACHAGYYTCYYRRYNQATDALEAQGKPVFDPGKVY